MKQNILNFKLFLLIVCLFLISQKTEANQVESTSQIQDNGEKSSLFNFGANSTVGYRIGQVTGYTKLKSFNNSALYRIQATQLDDGRPMKLLTLQGSHYEVGYAYGAMLAEEIEFTYKTLFEAELSSELQISVMEMYLDWQYRSYVKKYIPVQFLQEIKGIKDGGNKAGIRNLKKYIQRTLVLSNFPGDLENDIGASLFDQFLRSLLRIKNDKVLNYIQTNLIQVQRKIQQFVKSKAIMCSFFGVWGNRTENGQLYTMRNLDWASNTGMNLNKLVIVFNVTDTIQHVILGFPGLLGALTGISKAGITAHEAGQSSDLESMEGFQWTLRMRYVMMKATNLKQAVQIWNETKNTLGMNFMIGSAADNKAVVLQTMRGYTAYFYDNDSRQNRTLFEDHKGNMFVAGYSMPETVFRTNHAYDPIIRKHSRNRIMNQDDDSMIRYKILKDSFHYYENNGVKIGFQQALNMTAVLGDKGSQKFLSCTNNYKGQNVISVMYHPKQLLMWAAFQYGFKDTFRSGCCGVYVKIDLKRWFGMS